MGWFDPAEGLSDKAREVLERLANSGSSEAAGVADCLNTIASNGDAQEEDYYLLGCAEEIVEAANAFITEVKPSLFDALLVYARKGKSAEVASVIVSSKEMGGGRSRKAVFLQGSPLWTNFGDRAFVFANAADAQWFIDRYPESLAGSQVYERKN